MSKRFLSLVLALVMVLGTLGTVVLAAPSDVEGTAYEEAVARLELLGILEGYPDGTFRPDAQITRAEFAAVVIRAKGLEAVAKAAEGLPTGFSDVAATSWASGYVGTASKLGIVNGKGNGKFDPSAPVKYEEAVTMIIRALGYEPAAEARGAYPYGYLIVANEVGLLSKVKGTQGLPALRGDVAQLADNALEIPMMIQVGYGAQTKWVISGSKEHDGDAIFFLDEMGFDVAKGRVEVVDVDRNRIKVDGTTLTVGEDFDFNFVEGLKIKAWTSGGKVVVFTIEDEAIYGAAYEDADKIKIGGKSYKVDKDAYIELNGKEVAVKDLEDFEADYLKVVLNKDSDVIWAKGYDFDYALIVAEVDGNVAYDYNKDEANLKGYTILEDGKTISIEDLEELDVLLYNRGQKFAIVYNDSEVGEIDRVYTDEFRFEGDVYEITGEQKYLDDKVFGTLTDGVLSAMMAEEKDVEVFFNTQGEVVLVVGARGVAPTNSYYGYVTYANLYTGRGGSMLGLDVRNKEGKVVSYDIAGKDVSETSTPEYEYAELKVTNTNDLKDTVLLVTINKDEKATKLATVTVKNVTDKFKLTASYVNGYRLQDSTIIFHDGGKKAVELGEAKGFTEIKENSKIYVSTTDRIVAVVGDTNADSDTEPKTDLVTKVRRLGNKTYEFTFANGDRYVTSSKDDIADMGKYEKQIVELKVGKTSGLINGVPEIQNVSSVTVEKVSTGARTITDTNEKTYELATGAKLYDITGKNPKEIKLVDLKEGDVIKAHSDGGSSRFVRFVVRVDEKAKDDGKVEGVVTYINGGAALTKTLVLDAAPSGTNKVSVMYNNTTNKDILVKSGAVSVRLVNTDDGTIVAAATITEGADRFLPANISTKLGDVELQGNVVAGKNYEIRAYLDGVQLDGAAKIYVKSAEAKAKKVVVNGVEATTSDNIAFAVKLPADAVLADVLATQVVITPEHAKAEISVPPATANSGVTWTATIKAENGTTLQVITINVTKYVKATITNPTATFAKGSVPAAGHVIGFTAGDSGAVKTVKVNGVELGAGQVVTSASDVTLTKAYLDAQVVGMTADKVLTVTIELVDGTVIEQVLTITN